MGALIRRCPTLLLLLCASVDALPSRPWRRGPLEPQPSPAPASASPSPALWFEQTLDHFSPGDGEAAATWPQRYFANAASHAPGGPVFLCVGGEGPPLEPSVVESSGSHCVDAVGLAAPHGALLLALEHRFYGQSLPTPDFSTASLRLLSHDKALADLRTFRAHATQRFSLPPDTRWLAFGGSYPVRARPGAGRVLRRPLTRL